MNVAIEVQLIVRLCHVFEIDLEAVCSACPVYAKTTMYIQPVCSLSKTDVPVIMPTLVHWSGDGCVPCPQ